MTAAAAWPVCTICYEDLRPLSDQHLHCLPACGHVFHALWSVSSSPSRLPPLFLFDPAMSGLTRVSPFVPRHAQPGAMAGVLPGRKEEANLPRLQAGLRRRAPADPPLLPVHRHVPDPGGTRLVAGFPRGTRPGGARRRGRPPGAEGGVPRQGRRGAAGRHQEPQCRGERR
jgi:hypothetical protein